MTDEQFRALRTLIKDQGVKIEELALTIRTLQRRIEELAVDHSEFNPSEMSSTILNNDEFEALIKTRQPRALRSDSE